MKKTRSIIFIALLTFILSCGLIGLSHAADEEALGQQAEQSGKLRQALTHYVEALKTDGGNQKLREKIIALALKLDPPPVVPEEAERYMARGEAAVETANNEQAYTRAADEFKKALLVAPWLANAYFNLGLVLDKAGKYDKAIDNLNLYLIVAPHDKAAKKLKYKIEYHKEEAKTKLEEKRQMFADAHRKRVALLGGRWNKIYSWSQNDHGSNTPPTLQSSGWYMQWELESPAIVNMSGNEIYDFSSFTTEFRIHNPINSNHGYDTYFFSGTMTGKTIEGFVMLSEYCSPQFCTCEVNGYFPFTGEVSDDGRTLILVVDTSDDSCVGSFGAWRSSVRLTR